MAKILAVDDSESIAAFLEQTLRSAGYEVMIARDGLSALKIAHDELPDLIISDIVMPKMDGYGLMSEIRENPETKIIPIILLTVREPRKDWESGMLSEPDEYVKKPLDNPGELLSVVEKVLKKSKKSG